MCDECDAVWLDATALTPFDVVYAKAPDFIPPGLEFTIAAPISRWANAAEVQDAGWGDLVAGEGTALDG